MPERRNSSAQKGGTQFHRTYLVNLLKNLVGTELVKMDAKSWLSKTTARVVGHGEYSRTNVSSARRTKRWMSHTG